MSRSIEWWDVMEDGAEVAMRVSFPGKDKIRWQRKPDGAAQWEYDFCPRVQDWRALLERAEARYTRRRIPLKTVESIRHGMQQGR